jgi:hypothetical protein
MCMRREDLQCMYIYVQGRHSSWLDKLEHSDALGAKVRRPSQIKVLACDAWCSQQTLDSAPLPMNIMANTIPLYLIVYSSPIFKAHWSIWIPSSRTSPNGHVLGKLIHVTGDVLGGFVHEFKRNYQLGGTVRRFSCLELGQVHASNVVDVAGDGSSSSDTLAYDAIERCALSIPAPPKSLQSATSQVRLLFSEHFPSPCASCLHSRSQQEQKFSSRTANSGSESTSRSLLK